MLPTSIKSNKGGTGVPAGTYPATLTSAKLHINREYQSDCRYQAIALTWSIEGSRDAFVEKFVRLTLHERGTLANRLAALLGRPLTKDDAIDWRLADDAQTDAEIDRYDKDLLIVEATERVGVVGDLEQLLINGEPMIGRSCMLSVTLTADGWNRCSANGASPASQAAATQAERPRSSLPTAPPPNDAPPYDDDNLPF